tara:strand:+ start:2145 stop:3467 length:1323 start_codon:yes stop_codon:yes gene_type:complete
MLKFLNRIFNWKDVATVSGKTIGALAIVLGLLGVSVLFVNPMPVLASVLPFNYDNILGTGHWIRLEQSVVQGWLNTLWTHAVISASVSFVILLLGIVLFRKGLKKSLFAFGRGVKASPRNTIEAPKRLYHKVTVWRNWILEKVDYLQSESAKWRRTFQVLKSPYSLLRLAGFSPQMAVSFLIAGSAVGGGVVVNETVFAERSFNRGDAGVYAASVVGNNASLDIPTEYVEGSNTLRIDLGSTPVREITIENVSVGTVFTGSALPSGETNVVQVSGNTVTGGTNTRLEIGHLILENSRCKKLTLTDIQAHTILVRGNASDGQSLAPSPGTSRMRAIGGGHQQADAMITNGGTYDRIWIQAPSSGVNGKIGTLRLSNLYTKGGDCVLSAMNVGTMEILLNEIGMGDGFSTKEFTIATTVTGANITVTDNVEVTIAEPATAGH